ncbi:MAG: hypothetical protein FJY48_00360 [Betaproteobacteria bacterium]|nr:hypothetical protein [Betaproteobacteria bacterium]
MPRHVITLINYLKNQVDRLKLFLLLTAVYAAFNIANHYATESLYFETGAHLIHVPSGVRLVIVLIAGYLGSIALALASFPYAYWYLFNENLLIASIVSITTGLIPLFTFFLCKRLIQWQNDFADLTLRKLVILAVAYALINATVQQSIYYLFDIAARPLNGWLIMFTGDISGIFIVLYLLRIVAKVIKHRNQPTPD